MSLPLNWSTEQRMAFIEFRLFWDGRINRADLIKQFAISVPQASNDLRHYAALAPGNMTYDSSRKAYLSAEAFQPRFTRPDSDEYIAHLRRGGSAGPAGERGWIGRPPDWAEAPLPRRAMDASILRDVTRAIAERQSIEVHYQGLQRAEPRWRRLSPHALASDGFRWHARAHDATRDRFGDFVIARMLAVRAPLPATVAAEDDAPWRETMLVRIGPNPALDGGRQQAIALDFGMQGGERRIATRVALLFYLLTELRLDLDPDSKGPQVHPVVLLNRAEVEAGLRRAGFRPGREWTRPETDSA